MIFKLFLMLLFTFSSEAFECDFNFQKKYEEIFFSLNSTIIMECLPKYIRATELCDSNSVPMLWFHNSTNVIEKENRIVFLSHDQNLIIFYAEASDAGLYVCDSENKDGPINKTFSLRLIESSSFDRTIIADLLPRNSSEEKQDHLYWLPEMLVTKSMQQLYVQSPGDEVQFKTAYYVKSDNDNVDSIRVDWYLKQEESEEGTKIVEDRYKQQVVERPCNSKEILPRSVSGKCFFSTLTISNLNVANQGFYNSVARFSLTQEVGQTLNLTFSLRINRAKIDEPNNREKEVFINFNIDAKVCQNNYFDFNCQVSSRSYFTTIKKIYSNSSILIAEAGIDFINSTGNDWYDGSMGKYIPRSGIIHRIESVALSDAGTYICTAIPIKQMTDNERFILQLKKSMELNVTSCTASLSQIRRSTLNPFIIWCIMSLLLVIITISVIIYTFHYYSKSCLIKTVIVQHQNKLYVPHEPSNAITIPDVSIKTCQKFHFRHRNRSSSQLVPLPLSQKLSKYIHKNNIFNYRKVDASELRPVIETIGLSYSDSNKSNSSSSTECRPNQELIIQNESRTQYKLPQNIGRILSRDSVIIGSKIGEGAFGIVFSGIAKVVPNQSTPIDVAIKTLHDSFGDEDLINLIKEMEILKLIGPHKHIIALYGTYVDNGHPYMVMELAKNGNLRDFLRIQRNQTNPLCFKDHFSLTSVTFHDLLRFSLEIASGMDFLSSKMIIHRDLAARNILVDQFFQMKIADFGLTRAIENYYRKSTCGRLPIKWMAPECLFDRIYTMKSDVWSFGIVLWEIFTMGQTPYPTIQPNAIHQALRVGVRNEKPTLASDEIYKIMLSLWNDEPMERPSFKEILNKLSQITAPEPSKDTYNIDRPVNMEPSGCPLIKDYLEISTTPSYSTANM